MEFRGHKPVLRGTSYVCANCGEFLLDVRTTARLRSLKDVDPVKCAAVERRILHDPKLAKRLMNEDPREVVATYKLADKFNDFLMNPKARPDLQTPEAQELLKVLKGYYHNSKTDELMPWLVREWKKGRIRLNPLGPGAQGSALQFDGGEDYEHTDPYGNLTRLHSLTPVQLDHWADWYRSDHPSRKGTDIMKLTTPELHQTIKDWDADMRSKAEGVAQTRGDVEHEYPDGWTVQRLTTPKQLKDEGEKMGHCVGGYADDVAQGHSLIYSLRDHHNEPHATWEIEPRYRETPHGLYDVNTNKPVDGSPGPPQIFTEHHTPVPQGGKMVQIQGKGNEPPIPDYQKRIKDYFEHTIPYIKDRPQWGPQDYYNYTDLLPEEGYTTYHPGDYGLENPDEDFDWWNIINDASGSGPYDSSSEDPARVADLIHERGRTQEALKEHEKWLQAEKDRIAEEWGDYGPSNLLERYAIDNPPPDYDDPDSSYEQWDEERHQALQDQIDDARNEYVQEAPTVQWGHELESQLQQRLMQEQRAQEGSEGKGGEVVGPDADADLPYRQAATKRPHVHFTTGRPCFCTFTRHLAKVATLIICEACGDSLEHGRCKRCDWGRWHNSPDPKDPIADPTQDLKPAIENAI